MKSRSASSSPQALPRYLAKNSDLLKNKISSITATNTSSATTSSAKDAPVESTVVDVLSEAFDLVTVDDEFDDGIEYEIPLKDCNANRKPPLRETNYRHTDFVLDDMRSSITDSLDIDDFNSCYVSSLDYELQVQDESSDYTYDLEKEEVSIPVKFNNTPSAYTKQQRFEFLLDNMQSFEEMMTECRKEGIYLLDDNNGSESSTENIAHNDDDDDDLFSLSP